MFRIYSRFDVGAFCEWHECRGCEAQFAGDFESARFWLSGFLTGDEQAMTLRAVAQRAGDGYRLNARSGQDLVEDLAHRIASGQLRICQRQSLPVQDEAIVLETAPSAASTAPPPPPVRSRSAPIAPPRSEASTLPPNVDAAAMARVLRSAADEGVPFCEVCEEARRARETAAAEAAA